MRTVELIYNVVVNIYTLKRSAVLEFYGAQGRPVFIEVEDDEDVEVGYTYDKNLGFSKPSIVEFPPEPAQSITKADVIDWTERQLQAALVDIPETERTSWDIQVQEANALLAGQSIATPFINSQSTITGETREELAQKVLQKTAELAVFTGLVVGVRRKFIHLLEQGLNEPVFIGALDLALQQALGG